MDPFTDKTVRDELTFDILTIVSEPLSSEVQFKADVINALFKNLPTNHFEFASYQNTGDKENPITICNTVALNVSNIFWDEGWVRDYFETCVYNPNHSSVFSTSSKSVFKVSDIMDFSVYEKSNRNFLELMEPHGYYHSCVAYFKKKDRFMGHIAFMRKKEEGDFSEDEIEKIESVAPFIRNKLLDYKMLANARVHREVFYELISGHKHPVLLLDSNYRVISENESARQLCCEMVQQQELSDFALQNVVDTLLMYHLGKHNYFKLIGKDQKEYFISVKPYHVLQQNPDVVYLLYLNRKGFVGDVGTAPPLLSTEGSLTERQMEIVRLIAEGKTNADIAKELLISEHTVRKHVENIRCQLGVNNRVAILSKLKMI